MPVEPKHIHCWTLGTLLGAFSDHGKGTILEYDMYSTYNCIALGLLSTVAALPAFGRSRLMFYREAASGLNRYPA